MKLEGDIDELVFDYLEGNLDKEEQEAFDLLKEESETFAHHVRLWQNAYVTEDLPSTTELEERCMIRGGSGRGFVTSTALITSIVGLMLFVPSSVEDVKMKPGVPSISVRPVVEVELEPIRVIESIPSVTDLPMRDEPEVHVEEKMNVDELAIEIPAHARINELWVSIPVDLPANEIRPVEFSLKKPDRKTFSDREIERLKRHHDQRQRAAPFKPGNVPYVVPLNTKNF